MNEATLRLVEFFVEDERYLIEMDPVVGIISLTESAADGEVEVEGESLPRLDASQRLGGSRGAGRWGVVIERSEGRAVLVVSRVEGVVEVQAESILEPPDRAVGGEAGLVRGLVRIDEHLVVLLEAGRL